MPVLRATFVNKFDYKPKAGLGVDKVYYKHSYRCPVEAWFEATEDNPYGWVLQFESKNSHVLKQFRSDIFKDAIAYLEGRAGCRATEVNFDTIVDLAKAKEIRSGESRERKKHEGDKS